MDIDPQVLMVPLIGIVASLLTIVQKKYVPKLTPRAGFIILAIIGAFVYKMLLMSGTGRSVLSIGGEVFLWGAFFYRYIIEIWKPKK